MIFLLTRFLVILFQKVLSHFSSVLADKHIVAQVSGDLRNDVSIGVNFWVTDYSPVFTRLIEIGGPAIVHEPGPEHVM